MSNPDPAPDSTTTVVAFDTTINQRADGTFGYSETFTAEPGGTVEFQITQFRHGDLFDVPSLRDRIGQHITVNGPRPATGVLRSVDAAEDGLAVTLRIKVDS